jgi:hypothetical protein
MNHATTMPRLPATITLAIHVQQSHLEATSVTARQHAIISYNSSVFS